MEHQENIKYKDTGNSLISLYLVFNEPKSSITCLLHKNERLSLDPQQASKKQGTGTLVCHPGTGGQRALVESTVHIKIVDFALLGKRQTHIPTKLW